MSESYLSALARVHELEATLKKVQSENSALRGELVELRRRTRSRTSAKAQ